MPIFSGTSIGRPYTRVFAKDPWELCETVVPKACDRKQLQFFVETPVTNPKTGRKMWTDIHLASGSKQVYNDMQNQYDYCGSGVVVKFKIQARELISPNSTPEKFLASAVPSNTKPGSYLHALVASPGSGGVPPTDLAARLEVVSLETDDTASTESSDGTSTTGPRFEHSDEVLDDVVNEVEPYTMEEISIENAGQFVAIRFSGETILVDLDAFIRHARELVGNNRSLVKMKIDNVVCRITEIDRPDKLDNSGTVTRTFNLGTMQWIECLFPHSQVLRHLYSNCVLVDSTRKEQVRSIKKKHPELFKLLLNWVTDLLGLRGLKQDSEAYKKLRCLLARPLEASGCPLLIPPIYFTPEQSRLLGLTVVGGATMKTLQTFMEETVQEKGEDPLGICTYHAIACHIKAIFEIRASDFNTKAFKKCRENFLIVTLPQALAIEGEEQPANYWLTMLPV